MRLISILALSLAAAGAAHGQIQPPRNPYAISPPTIGSTTSGGAFKPYEPPRAAADPFSPAGEAARERNAAAAERARENGAFSPIGEAARERRAAAAERARENGAFSPMGEAARERRAAAAERARENGVFSPAGEAKREREQAKRDKANNPF